MEGVITNAYIQGGALGLLFVVLLAVWYLERRERLSIQKHNIQLYKQLFDLTIELKVSSMKFLEYLEKRDKSL